MTDMFENLIDTLKKNPKKIVFTGAPTPASWRPAPGCWAATGSPPCWWATPAR